VSKRYAVQVAAHNLGLLMRKLFGVGKPRTLQGSGGGLAGVFLRLSWLCAAAGMAESSHAPWSVHTEPRGGIPRNGANFNGLLWTFIEGEGVELTNNAAEQALRQAIIWRKLSLGMQSSEGSRFVERLLTVVETSRRQKRNVLSWMVEAVEARFAGKSAPSLLSGV
jgi:hypothetical protein